MKHIILNGKTRAKGKKSDVKAIRKNGDVPCVLYGMGMDNVLFTVPAKELKQLTHTPNSYIVDLDVDGTKYLAVMHELQFHPVTDATIHADFLAISADKPVVIDVPLNIFGSCEGVKQGGKLLIEARKLKVSGLPDALPDVLDVDITNLKLGKQITAGDLSYEGVTIVSPKSTGVCTVKHTRAAAAADTAEEAAPAAEGETAAQ
ncbi:MAG TPA: 50S ribosomal protein L25 [Candidatus Coprenecus stercoripullorum]|nr:50S ribosomal protein L25 [Candidatus Coprenecus stercoripullorum]